MRRKLLLFFIIAGLAGCSKSIFDPPGTAVHLDPAMQRAFEFQKGTYWIYNDVVTGNTDSFYVSNVAGRVYSTTPHNPQESQHFDIVDITIVQRHISVVTPEPDSVLWNINLQNKEMALTSDNRATAYYNNPLIYYPFPAGMPTGDYTFNTHTYTNVAVRSVIDSVVPSVYGPGHKEYDSIYLCQGTGFIRMKFFHPDDTFYHDWQLQRCWIKM